MFFEASNRNSGNTILLREQIIYVYSQGFTNILKYSQIFTNIPRYELTRTSSSYFWRLWGHFRPFTMETLVDSFTHAPCSSVGQQMDFFSPPPHHQLFVSFRYRKRHGGAWVFRCDAILFFTQCSECHDLARNAEERQNFSQFSKKLLPVLKMLPLPPERS